MKTKPKDYSRQYLRSERLQSGFSVKRLAQRTGIAISTIIGYENGSIMPSIKRWQRLKEVLGIDTWRTPEPESMPEPVTFSFEIGRSYTIKDIGWRSKECDLISPSSGWNCTFLYTGKDGIHHVFTETQGGWRRTYTDAQLIGKKIEEAEV